MDTTNPTHLESVGDLAINIIVSKLNSSEAASVSCVNKRFKDWASDDSIWSCFCHQELKLSEPVDPLGNHCASFKAHMRAWEEAYGMLSAPFVLPLMRVKNVWTEIRSVGYKLGGLEQVHGDIVKILRFPSNLDNENLIRFIRLHVSATSRELVYFRAGSYNDSITNVIDDSQIYYEYPNVRASAVFVPEFSNLMDEEEKYLFAYSIRLSLKPEGCVVDGVSYDSCQLYWRKWLIKSNDTVVGRTNGEAVIGLVNSSTVFTQILWLSYIINTLQYPLLRPGEKEFIYESCSNLPASSGSIEGSFTFLPGRLRDPKGSPFEVEVAKFPLQLPDYIF
ncbi:hypothetical protein CTI12_AA424660 [Artemisia annua]|uniref:ApaG domain-containing protein n=1 Tax=Artemisia annua TaxID=35608 RepID=A0A2U1M2L8_ARTAN|nr:hypothetical protein CTI12_AA424660 [Artemisia annua]